MQRSAATQTNNRFERCIRNLAQGTAPETIKASLNTLDAAGTDAFPALLAHLNDPARAEPEFFQREIVDRMPSGEWRLHPPAIGEVCFDMIQGQIEGNWPKDFRDFYTLEESNVRQWLAAHRGLNLEQLRAAAQRESLSRAQAELAKHPSNERLRKIVDFIQKPFAEKQ